jgi:hypothetical protein
MLIIKKPEGKRVTSNNNVLSVYERQLLNEAIREDSEMLKALAKM